mgnify:CR=1 FL=1|tara:strand:+ start:1394 stop:1801 length:408 start_codon:yes stop_codon:yes gene_type:complete
MQPNLQHREPIAKYVRQAVQDGVQIKDILATVNKKYQDAPRNNAMLYKLYGGDIAEARADITQQVGNVVIQQALDGHFPSQDLFLRSKAGWSPKETQQLEDIEGDPDEDSSAINSLLNLLGHGSELQEEDSNSGS